MVKLVGPIGVSVLSSIACGPQVGLPQAGDGSSDSGGEVPTPGSEATATTDDPTSPSDPGDGDGGTAPWHPDLGGAGESSTDSGPPGSGCESPGSCDRCLVWETFMQGAAGFDDRLEHLAISPDDHIVALGRRDAVDNDDGDGVLQVFDASGSLLDDRSLFESVPNEARSVTALAIALDGRIAVVGTHAEGDVVVATVDLLAADGTEQEQRVLMVDPGVSVVPTAAAFAGDGALLVSGRHEGLDAVPIGFVRRFDAELANAWELVGEQLGENLASIDAIDARGDRLRLAGAVPGSLWLATLEHDGTPVWTADDSELPGDGHAAADLAVSPSGDVLVAGWQGDTGSWGVPWIARFDGSDGSSVWTRTEPSDAEGPSGFDAITITDDGRIFVAGVVMGDDGRRQRHVDELDCDGVQVWRWVHENPDTFDWATGGDLAWSPSLGVVVSGGDYVDGDIDHRAFVARLGT